MQRNGERQTQHTPCCCKPCCFSKKIIYIYHKIKNSRQTCGPVSGCTGLCPCPLPMALPSPRCHHPPQPCARWHLGGCPLQTKGIYLGPRELLGRNVPFYPRSIYSFSFLPSSHPSCFQPDLPAQPCLFPAPSPARFVQFSPKFPVNFPPRSEPSSLFGRGRDTRLWFSSLHLFLPVQTEVVGLCTGGGLSRAPSSCGTPVATVRRKQLLFPGGQRCLCPRASGLNHPLFTGAGEEKKSKFGKSKG